MDAGRGPACRHSIGVGRGSARGAGTQPDVRSVHGSGTSLGRGPDKSSGVPRSASLAPPLVAEGPSSALASVGLLRSRPAGVDVSQLEGARRAVAQGRPARLRLDLFPDVNLNAMIERIGDSRTGYSLSGRMEGQPHGGVTLVVSGEALVGPIHSQQGNFSIAYRNGAVHTIREILGEFKCGFDGRLPRAAVRGHPNAWARMASKANDGSEVDLLVLFRDSARRVEGGLQQMHQSIDLAVAWTNDVYESSGVNFRLNSVGAVQVDCQKSRIQRNAGVTNQAEHLKKLIDPADGFVDEAHFLRDRFAAALVRHRDRDVDAVPLRGDPDRGRDRRVPRSVGDEVVEDLDDAARAGQDPRQILRQVDMLGVPAAAAQERVAGLVDHAVDLRRLGRDRQRFRPERPASFLARSNPSSRSTRKSATFSATCWTA